MTDHDQLWKRLLQRFLREFLEEFLPEEARRLDFRRVRFLNAEEFLDVPQGERREVDVLAEVPTFEGEPELVLVHVEVEARYREAFSQRMFEYYAMLWLRHRKPILPIALVLSGGQTALGEDTYEQQLFARPILTFQYRCIGLGNLEAPAYADTRNPLTVAAMPLMRLGEWTPAELTFRCLARAAETAPDEAAQYLVVDTLKTYTAGVVDQTEVRTMAETAGRPDLLDLWSKPTWGTRMRQEAEAEGRAEGRAEGMAKGKAEGMARGRAEGMAKGRAEGAVNALTRAAARALRARFGETAPAEAALRERFPSPEALETLIERAATAASLTELELAK